MMEKTYKETIMELVEETTSLKYAVTNLANQVEKNNLILETQTDLTPFIEDLKEQYVKVAEIEKAITTLTSMIDKLNVQLHKLDDSTYRMGLRIKGLEEAINKQTTMKESYEKSRLRMLKKISEKAGIEE
jgi:septal ring factor EnvC (AmiA/AmiB activator)